MTTKKKNPKLQGRVVINEFTESSFGYAGGLRLPDVGTYVGHKTALVPCDVPCPYCHGPMIEAETTRAGRVVRVVKRVARRKWAVMLQDIPNTYRALACKACVQAFTLPRQTQVDLKSEPYDALKFSQAACNAANAMCALKAAKNEK